MWLRPGGDHCDHELAVEVWGATLILGLLFVSGRDHCDHELAVEVRQCPLSSGAVARRRRKKEGRKEGRREGRRGREGKGREGGRSNSDKI